MLLPFLKGPHLLQRKYRAYILVLQENPLERKKEAHCPVLKNKSATKKQHSMLSALSQGATFRSANVVIVFENPKGLYK